MPRKPVQYCNSNPYFVTARSNNKDWFDVPLDYCYGIYINVLAECIERFGIQLHAFVLMSNHFHMLITTPLANISTFLRYFMTESSRGIKFKSNRINHMYGSRNHKSLITDPIHFAHCYKYLYRNPVRAGICTHVEDYKWSSISNNPSRMHDLITNVNETHQEYLPDQKIELIDWLNVPTSKEIEELCRIAVKRSKFEFKPLQGNKVLIDPKKELIKK